MPPNVKLIKANIRLGEQENKNIPKKNPLTPVIKIIDKYFCGERLPIIKAPIRAPKPSEEAKIPILNSDNNNFSLPNTGIKDTNGKPKILKIRVVINTILKLTRLYTLLPVFNISFKRPCAQCSFMDNGFFWAEFKIVFLCSP